MENKIKISEVSKRAISQKGFDEKGCFGCKCKDSCCRFGADFDKEAYDLVVLNKNLIEPLVNRKIEDCFEKKWSSDKEFLGNDSIRSVKNDQDFCIFHNTKGKGCMLYHLVNTQKIDRRMVPSICRLFPLSWNKRKLIVADEEKGSVIPDDCNCVDPENTTSKSIIETQKKEIEDIFEIEK